MKFRHCILAIGIVLVASSLAPALAQWSQKDRQDTTRDCVASCQRNDAKLAPRNAANDPAFLRRLDSLTKACAAANP